MCWFIDILQQAFFCYPLATFGLLWHPKIDRDKWHFYDEKSEINSWTHQKFSFGTVKKIHLPRLALANTTIFLQLVECFYKKLSRCGKHVIHFPIEWSWGLYFVRMKFWCIDDAFNKLKTQSKMFNLMAP